MKYDIIGEVGGLTSQPNFGVMAYGFFITVCWDKNKNLLAFDRSTP